VNNSISQNGLFVRTLTRLSYGAILQKNIQLVYKIIQSTIIIFITNLISIKSWN